MMVVPMVAMLARMMVDKLVGYLVVLKVAP